MTEPKGNQSGIGVPRSQSGVGGIDTCWKALISFYEKRHLDTP